MKNRQSVIPEPVSPFRCEGFQMFTLAVGQVFSLMCQQRGEWRELEASSLNFVYIL